MIGPASAVTQWGSAGSRSTAANIATYQLLTFVTHLNKRSLLGKWEWAAGCQCQNCTLSKLGRRVFCHLISHNCSLTQSCENISRFIFTFRWKTKINAILRKSAEKSHNCWTQFHATVRYKKKHPIQFPSDRGCYDELQLNKYFFQTSWQSSSGNKCLLIVLVINLMRRD